MKKELQDCMTSELLFQAMNVDTSDSDKATLLAEYERRLGMMGLTDKQTVKFREADETSINNGCYISPDVLLLKKPFIEAGMSENSIKMENCTFSELVYLTEEAQGAYVCNTSFPTETQKLVHLHAINCKAKKEIHSRMESIGLTKEQKDIFIRNETQIAERVRWDYPCADIAWC